MNRVVKYVNGNGNGDKEINWMTNNVLPIILLIITWVTGVAILSTKVDYLAKSNNDLVESWKLIETRLGKIEVAIAVNETQHMVYLDYIQLHP